MIGMIYIDKRLEWFFKKCRAKMLLPQNMHKEGWHGMNYLDLMQRLKEETEELTNGILFQSRKQIISEAADVANFAMMIADNARTDSSLHE